MIIVKMPYLLKAFIGHLNIIIIVGLSFFDKRLRVSELYFLKLRTSLEFNVIGDLLF
jgi:hypothetical protein